MHEAQLHEDKSFNTLTFSDDHLPLDYGVDPRHLQLFFKRLRKKIGKFRYFAVGEYGDELLRPHYHFVLFGNAFLSDRYLWRRGPRGDLNYRSPLLESCWPFGHSETAPLTVDNAGYAARYLLKKINGEKADEHYRRVHPITGEVSQVHREFLLTSRRPGLGAGYFERYRSDVFPSDFVIVEGQKASIPRYYMKLLEKELALLPQVGLASNEADWVRHGRIKSAREREARDPGQNTAERLAVREEMLELKASRLKRTLGEDQ